jgi:hypothetical protein
MSQMGPIERYGRLLRIWETNYGRDAGWVVERNGVPIARLTGPRGEDMFWDSYAVDVITADNELSERFSTPQYWLQAESDGLVWRNLEFGETADFAFPAISPFAEPGRLLMRGLYLSVAPPKPWDRLVL